MERRGFFAKITAAGIGAIALVKSSKVLGRALPSDPGANRKEPLPDPNSAFRDKNLEHGPRTNRERDPLAAGVLQPSTLF